MTDEAEQAVEDAQDQEETQDREEARDRDGARDDEGAETRESSLVEEVAAHDEALAAEVAELESRAAELESDLAEAESEVEDLTERLQRTQADFQNYKKRSKRKQEEIRERATEDLVERLLDVRDNLNRALEEESEDVESLREGVELTKKEFDRVLDAEGVEEVAPDPGDETDPRRHEVVMRVDADQPEGTVVDVYRPGYEMSGTVLREAQVTVSSGTVSSGDEE